MITILINKILSLALMMLLGVILVKCRVLKPSDSRVLSSLSLYIIMPCVILTSFQVELTSDVRSGLLLALGAAVVIQAVLILLNIPLKKLLRLDPVEQTSIIYSNAGNLIVPLVTALLGQDWVIYSCAYLSTQMVLLWSHGKTVLCVERGFDVKKIVANVNMISIALGLVLLFTGVRLPAVINDTMSSVSATVGPVAMIITGMLIGGRSLRDLALNGRLWMVTALRLLGVPALVLAMVKFSGIAGLVPNGEKVLLVTLLATSTPSSSTITQFAQVYGQDADYAGAVNVLTTILCILTMPVMVTIYQL